MDQLPHAIVDATVGAACVAALTYMLRAMIGRTLPALHRAGLDALDRARDDFSRFLSEQRAADAERMARVEARWERAAQAAYTNNAQVAEQLGRVENSLAALAERLDRENGHGRGE